MDMMLWEYKERDGVPPNGEQGYFLGYDADRQPYLLMWSSRGGGAWMAVSFDKTPDGGMPVTHILEQSDSRVTITRWAALPLR